MLDEVSPQETPKDINKTQSTYLLSESGLVEIPNNLQEFDS